MSFREERPNDGSGATGDGPATATRTTRRTAADIPKRATAWNSRRGSAKADSAPMRNLERSGPVPTDSALSAQIARKSACAASRHHDRARRIVCFGSVCGEGQSHLAAATLEGLGEYSAAAAGTEAWDMFVCFAAERPVALRVPRRGSRWNCAVEQRRGTPAAKLARFSRLAYAFRSEIRRSCVRQPHWSGRVG
jgi:hypothetical protein